MGVSGCVLATHSLGSRYLRHSLSFIPLRHGDNGSPMNVGVAKAFPFKRKRVFIINLKGGNPSLAIDTGVRPLDVSVIDNEGFSAALS